MKETVTEQAIPVVTATPIKIPESYTYVIEELPADDEIMGKVVIYASPPIYGEPMYILGPSGWSEHRPGEHAEIIRMTREQLYQLRKQIGGAWGEHSEIKKENEALKSEAKWLRSLVDHFVKAK